MSVVHHPQIDNRTKTCFFLFSLNAFHKHKQRKNKRKKTLFPPSNTCVSPVKPYHDQHCYSSRSEERFLLCSFFFLYFRLPCFCVSFFFFLFFCCSKLSKISCMLYRWLLFFSYHYNYLNWSRVLQSASTSHTLS